MEKFQRYSLDKYNFSEHSLHYRKGMEGDGLKAFEKFKGIKSSLLEIGIYEGGSAIWFLENILTHNESLYIGIDDNVRENAIENLKWFKDKIEIILGDSKNILPILERTRQKYDMIYIDGCHIIDYALNDIEVGLRLLNSNGVMLIDDYDHEEYKLKQPIDNYISKQNNIEILFKGYRIAIRKLV
jgi:predicted O-methyltransferase YrrM